MKRPFTLLTGIMVAIGISAFFCHRAALQQRESALKQDLRMMRGAIDSYIFEKKHEPQSLGDLVAGDYMSEVPTDPVTSKTDWVLVFDHPSECGKSTERGIVDVHSPSGHVGINGLAYSDW